MRAFISPRPGRALASIDYASQEFLIAAVLSQDYKMMEAYESGDVYLAFAKAARLVPSDGTKSSHKKERDMCKALVLGISYDMSPKGLSGRLGCTEKQAEEYVSTFFDTYPDYAHWKEDTLFEYSRDSYLALPDGWVMWGDNDNKRSVGNFPVQGHGAVVMRDAVARAQDEGLDVVYTLHDALTIEFASKDHKEAITLLMTAMSEAFHYVMSRYGKCPKIRLEGETWSRDYEGEPTGQVPDVGYMTTYITEKGAKDYERYKKFFN